MTFKDSFVDGELYSSTYIGIGYYHNVEWGSEKLYVCDVYSKVVAMIDNRKVLKIEIS